MNATPRALRFKGPTLPTAALRLRLPSQSHRLPCASCWYRGALVWPPGYCLPSLRLSPPQPLTLAASEAHSSHWRACSVCAAHVSQPRPFAMLPAPPPAAGRGTGRSLALPGPRAIYPKLPPSTTRHLSNTPAARGPLRPPSAPNRVPRQTGAPRQTSASSLRRPLRGWIAAERRLTDRPEASQPTRPPSHPLYHAPRRPLSSPARATRRVRSDSGEGAPTTPTPSPLSSRTRPRHTDRPPCPPAQGQCQQAAASRPSGSQALLFPPLPPLRVGSVFGRAFCLSAVVRFAVRTTAERRQTHLLPLEMGGGWERVPISRRVPIRHS